MDSYLYKKLVYLCICTHWQVPGVMHVPFFSSQPGAQIAVKKKTKFKTFFFFSYNNSQRCIRCIYIFHLELYSILRDGNGETGTWQMLPDTRGSDGFSVCVCICVQMNEYECTLLPKGGQVAARVLQLPPCANGFLLLCQNTPCARECVDTIVPRWENTQHIVQLQRWKTTRRKIKK